MSLRQRTRKSGGREAAMCDESQVRLLEGVLVVLKVLRRTGSSRYWSRKEVDQLKVDTAPSRVIVAISDEHEVSNGLAKRSDTQF